MSSETDWQAIEREYRAGQLSVHEIARQYGVSHTAIHKRAKREKWTRNLAGKVREAVAERLVSDGVSGKVSATEAVETAAMRGVQIVLSHRNDISQLRALATILATRLSEHLDGLLVSSKGVLPGIGEKESPSDMLVKLTGVRAKLIPLERQAFNLDLGPMGEDPMTGAKPVSNLDRAKSLHSLLATLKTKEAA